MLRDSPHLAWFVALLKNLGLWGWVPGHSTPTFCSWACFCLLLSQASCATISHMAPDPYQAVCNPKVGFWGALISGPRGRCPGYPLHQRT